MLAFLASLYNEKMNPEITVTVQWLTYGFSVAAAVVWGILNYIDHIKLGSTYRKYDNIDVYVNSLIMSSDEKAELKAYLEDYSKDLVIQGKSQEEAVKAAINQFRVQEFTSISKNNEILDLPIHYYLIGYTFIALLAALTLEVITGVMLGELFLLHALEFVFFLYGIGFIGMYFLYKLIDSALSKKIRD